MNRQGSTALLLAILGLSGCDKPAARPATGAKSDTTITVDDSLPTIEAARAYYDSSVMSKNFGKRDLLEFRKVDGRRRTPRGVETYDLLFEAKVQWPQYRPSGVWNNAHKKGEIDSECGFVAFQKYESGWKPMDMDLKDDCGEGDSPG